MGHSTGGHVGTVESDHAHADAVGTIKKTFQGRRDERDGDPSLVARDNAGGRRRGTTEGFVSGGRAPVMTLLARTSQKLRL